MNGINKVIIIGNLGGDPECFTFDDGGMVTNINVATSEKWKDKNTGQQQERTEWHRIAFSGRLAEVAAQYLRKGAKVYIEGSLKTRKYQDKQTGADRYSTDIMARTMQMLDSNQPPLDDPNRGQTVQQQQQQQQQNLQQQQNEYNQRQSQQSGGRQQAGKNPYLNAKDGGFN